MRQSSGYFPTLREIPKEAEAKSHILMLRAGLIRQLAAGLYTYLPVARRALLKIEQIVREEMDAAGAIEILMPTLQPDSLWKESGRWDVMGPELMRLKDRSDRLFVLGPTHEEVVTNLVAGELRSYRDLPKNLYQIQTKFRDEIRPRFGIVRAREFIMKDGYSFDVDEAGAAHSYQRMFDAYKRMFKRMGLTTMPVEADTGAMGGSHSHEFMVPAAIGEAEIVSCPHCGYQTNRELTPSCPIEETAAKQDSIPPIAEVHTPDLKTVEEVAAFLQTTPQQMIKTMVYTANDKPYVILLRGDHTINEAKVARAVGAPIEMASPEMIFQVTRAAVGFAGPVGLRDCEIWADHHVRTIASGVAGANKTDYHICNVVHGRDYQVNRWEDFRCVDPGDLCPKCRAGNLAMSWGIEIGHVFVLGTKYSKALGAYYTDPNGEQKPMVMGCYGIGVSRILAAIIEEHANETGIDWPVSIAPYHVHLLNLSLKNEAVTQTAEQLYTSLLNAGFGVVLDDRDERPGIKFKDSDLFGFPYQIVVGEKSLQNGTVELLIRSTNVKESISPDSCVNRIQEQFQSDMARLAAA
ncbi:MAG: proline--tRNA ligase [Candidatus Omnitrophota bacterium]|jgi:prolyl-tRNA synthetase|nr:MAG: proline--tRNA ligase [Candidatus Omnitrophota bacterium]